MHENNYLKYIKFIRKVLLKLRPRFSFHYVAYTTLFFLVIFSVLQLVSAATPNPGHPWSQIGDGVFIFTNGATDPLDPKTYTFPNANATVLTTNAAVTLGQGGTGASLSDPGAHRLFGWNDTDNATKFITIGSNLNYDPVTDTLSAAAGMVYPGAGIANSTGSGWGTSYTTTGSGTVLALQTSPAFTTPSLGVATATSVDFGTTTLLGSRALTVDTGGVFDINLGTASGDDFTVDTSSLVVEGDTGRIGIGTTSPTSYLHLKAGTAIASTAPLKFTAGTNLTDAEAGAMEWDGTNLFITQTTGPTRKTLAYTSDISVTKTGTASDNQVAVWTGDGIVEGSSDFTFDGSILSVSVNATEPTIKVSNTGGFGGAAFQFTDTASTADWKFKATTSGGFKIRDNTSSLDVFTIEQSALANALYIKAGGNIGIRDTTPDGTLDIDSSITSGIDFGITNTGVYTGTGLLNVTANSATTGVLGLMNADGLSSGSILSLASNGTAGLTGQKGLSISLSGTNGTTGQTTYSTYLSNTHAGSGTNVGLYTTASGGTNNLGLNVDAGQTLIGGTTLTTENATQTLAKLNIVSTMSSNGSDSAIAGIHGYHTFTNGGNANYTQVGNRFYFENTPTTNSNTMVGEIIRVKDSSGLANLVRGIDVNTSDDGSNTLGTNTGIRAKGRTFGIQGITNASAGGVSVPAAIYGESTGTTQGDVLRLFSNSMTSAPSFATFYHNTSTFTGVGLKMDFAAGSGTFSGDYLEFKNGGSSRFKVTNAGIVSMGLSATASTTAVCSSLANTATPVGGTTYEIRDCSGAPAADYAEMYPVEKEIEYGDIVATGDELINTYDTTEGEIDWNKVKGKVTKLIKSTDPYQKNVIGIASDNYGDFSSTGYNIKDEDNPMPVALNGRVPVKISENSEPIEVGDYLTTSSQPGKATKALESGQVIGKALEPWNPSSGKKTVMLFIEQGYQNSQSLANSFSIDVDSVSEDGILVSQKILEELINNDISTDDYLSEVLTDRLVAGLEVITPNIVTNNLSAQGEVNFNGLTYFNESVDFAESVTFKNQTLFEVPPLFNSDTAGFAVVKEGAREVRVSFDNPYMTTPVVTTSITFEKNTESGDSDFEEGMFFDQDIKSVVKDKDETGFTIVLNKKASQDINFSWIALAVKDAKIYESVIEGLVFTDTTDTTIGDTIIEEDIIIEETTEDIIEDTVIEEEIIIEDIISQETSTGDTTTEIITEEVSESIPETESTSSTEINI